MRFVIFFFYISLNLFSQNDSVYFETICDLRKGEIVNLLEEPTDKIGNIYFFISERDCYSCFANMEAIYKIVNSRYKINFLGFLSGQSQKFADKYKINNKILFPIIGDKIFLYSKHFKVKLSPLFIITNKFGKVLAFDKCGSTHTSIEEILKILDNESKQLEGVKKASDISKIKRKVIINKKGGSVSSGKLFFPLFSKTNKLIYLLNSTLKQILIIDTNGVIQKTIDMKTFKNIGIDVMSPRHLSWMHEDSIIILTDINKQMEPIFYTYDIINNNINIINVKYPWPPYNTNKPLYNKKNNNFYFDLNRSTFTSLDTIPPYVNTIMEVNLEGIELKKFGKPSDLYSKLKVSKVFSNKLAIDNKGNVYDFQAGATNVNIYTSSGEYVKSIHMNFSNKYRTPKKDFETNGNVFLQWISWNKKISYPYYIDVDSDRNEIALMYNTVDYPENITDPQSAQADFRLFFHKSDLHGNNLFGKDIEIPKNARIVNSVGNNIMFIEQVNDEYHLVKYTIKNKN